MIQLSSCRGIRRSKRLVHQEHVGSEGYSRGDGNTLLPAREYLRTCETSVVSREIDNHDSPLDEEERESVEAMMICAARFPTLLGGNLRFGSDAGDLRGIAPLSGHLVNAKLGRSSWKSRPTLGGEMLEPCRPDG